MSDHLIKLLRDISVRRGRFTLASGTESDLYVDIRTAALHSEASYVIASRILDILKPEVRAVAGVVLGGAPLVSSTTTLARVRNRHLHGLLIRKEPKAHGTGNQVEGMDNLRSFDVALLEDTVTTGSSLLRGIGAAEEMGLRVIQVIAVLDREVGGSQNLWDHGYELESLVRLRDLVP